ncbi:MAG TPA: hypothetical protein VFF64_28550 [Candidatus Eremiobacteraceae bacterium]|nr:hypothetical protein [Candidatus Eremiobacteraceae bacterium]
MAEVVHDAQQEFWRSPTVLPVAAEPISPIASLQGMTDACADCHSEFMIGARFCHTCGLRRPALGKADTSVRDAAGLLARSVASVRPWVDSVAAYWREISFPDWLHYLHFHEIKRWVGLPTGALIAFMIGLGCVAGAMGISLFYRASNLAEFQAIQMWRIEWLLAATASFVAGILLKGPSDGDSE